MTIVHPITTADVRRIYDREVARLAELHAETPQDQPLPLLAWRGTRTLVHEQIHQVHAPPPPRAAGDSDRLHHAKATDHNEAVWRETDRLVAEAGITHEGVN